MLKFTFWSSSLDNHAESTLWSAGCMWSVGWNEECFTLTYDMVNDPPCLVGLDDNVAFELEKELL